MGLNLKQPKWWRRSARRGRAASRVGMMGIAALTVLLIAACTVTNPGDFTLTADGSQSSITITPSSGAGLDYPLSSACSNGVDDDLDGDTDLGDSNCTSSSDNNERLSGSQTYSAFAVPFNISSNATVTLQSDDASGSSFERCYTTSDCVTISVVGTSATQTGSWNQGVLSISFPFYLDIDPAVGFSGMGTTCKTPTISAVATMNSYNLSTGATSFTASGTLGSVSTCGSWNDAVNAVLAAPGSTIDLTLNGTSLNSSNYPIYYTL